MGMTIQDLSHTQTQASVGWIECGLKKAVIFSSLKGYRGSLGPVLSGAIACGVEHSHQAGEQGLPIRRRAFHISLKGNLISCGQLTSCDRRQAKGATLIVDIPGIRAPGLPATRMKKRGVERVFAKAIDDPAIAIKDQHFPYGTVQIGARQKKPTRAIRSIRAQRIITVNAPTIRNG
jgi:hypothetical protein